MINLFYKNEKQEKIAQKLGVVGEVEGARAYCGGQQCGQGGLIEKGRFDLRLEGEKGMGQVIIWRKIE